MKKICYLGLLLTLCLCLCSCKSSDYKKALAQMEAEKYQQASELFGSLGEYKDSAELRSQCSVKECESLIDDIGLITYYSSNIERNLQKAISAYQRLSEAEKASVRNSEALKKREEEYREVLYLEEAGEYVVEKAVQSVKSCANSTFKLRTDKKSHASVYRSDSDPNVLHGNYTVYFSLNDNGLRENYKYVDMYTLKIEDGEFTDLDLGKLKIAVVSSFMNGGSSYFKPQYDD